MKAENKLTSVSVRNINICGIERILKLEWKHPNGLRTNWVHCWDESITNPTDELIAEMKSRLNQVKDVNENVWIRRSRMVDC